MTVFLTVVFAIPLGMPIGILIFGAGGHTLRAVLDDPGFLTGLGMQAFASLVGLRSLIAALSQHSPDELRLKRRFAIAFLRWVCVLMVAMSPLAMLPGAYGALLLVVV